MERKLIAEYRDTVRGLLGELSAANIDKALAIAGLPEEIRGYGHVKERSFLAAQAKRAQLLQAYRAPAGEAVAGEAAAQAA
jgi:indolepyruvate ferredoxin oxidoreductase